MPRMAFLTEKVNRPGSVWGLNLILTPSDEVFAEKVAGTSTAAYAQFKAAYAKQLERLNADRAASPDRRANSGMGGAALPGPPSLKFGLGPRRPGEAL